MAKALSLDVISIGDVSVDLLMHVPHHPNLDPEGDRGAAVRGSRCYLGPGGVAANVASSLARLGNRVGLIGVVGDDDLGRILIKSLLARGIDLQYLQTIPDHQTSLVSCFESSNGQAVHYACPGPIPKLSDSLSYDYLNSARLLFVAGSTITQDERTGHSIIKAMEQARGHGVKVALDPGKFWLNMDLVSSVQNAVASADILLPNAYEAELLTGLKSASEAARALMSKGLEVVVIKQGAAGCVACTKNEDIEAAGFQTPLHSSLGAGDSFNGGFLHGLLRGWSLGHTARFANATAGLKIRTSGTQAGLPSEDDVKSFLEGQGNGTQTPENW